MYLVYNKDTGEITNSSSSKPNLSIYDSNLPHKSGFIEVDKEPKELRDFLVVDDKLKSKPENTLVTQKKAEKEYQVRLKRNSKLDSTDWTQVPDSPVNKKAWADYRQALRDITEQEGYPDNIIWPEPPKEKKGRKI